VHQGGAGLDAASYETALAGVRADLQIIQTNTGDAAGDSYVSVENLIGSDLSDLLAGDAMDNHLSGGDTAMTCCLAGWATTSLKVVPVTMSCMGEEAVTPLPSRQMTATTPWQCLLTGLTQFSLLRQGWHSMISLSTTMEAGLLKLIMVPVRLK